ncbi:MAG: anaerobic ribonucleoside-triphosphate reductase activating protein [Bacilli bacterium]
MKIRLASPLQPDSIVDGKGIRAVIWTQGCIHNCLGCHNPETHDPNGGMEYDTNEIKKQLKELTFEDGITLSGGDPFNQVDACLDIAKYARTIGLSVWCYTGFTFEQLLKMANMKSNIMEFLNYIDVLVDGKFEVNKKSFECKWRGSTNQRLIDVYKSLKFKKTVLYETEKKPVAKKQIVYI